MYRKFHGGLGFSTLSRADLVGPAGYSQSCYCPLLLLTAPHSLFTRLTQILVYCLGLRQWSRISPRKIFRTLLQFLCTAFHSVDLSETLDLWHVFYPSANAQWKEITEEMTFCMTATDPVTS